MTKQEHEMMLVMFARTGQMFRILTEVLTSRGIVTADDARAFSHAIHYDDEKTLKTVLQTWDDYQAAYQIALERCSTKWAPWFIVPANHKWYRNAVVAKILLSTLRALHLAYPADMPGLDKIRIE